jgi:hypothetical protein
MYDETTNRSERNSHAYQKQTIKTLIVINRNAILIQG